MNNDSPQILPSAATLRSLQDHSSFHSEYKHDKWKALCLCVFGLFHLSSHKPQLLSSLQSTETHLIVFHIVFKLHSYRFFFVSPSKILKLKPRHLKRFMCFFGPRIFTKKKKEKKEWKVRFWLNGETACVAAVSPPRPQVALLSWRVRWTTCVVTVQNAWHVISVIINYNTL